MQQKSALAESLRTRLRRDLAVVHERLDQAISRLDLTARADYGVFLVLHRQAFGGLTAPGAATAPDLADTLAALDLDIAALGLRPTEDRDAMEVAGLALDYVFLGSRLGTKVLRRHWQAALDPVVRGAGAYFALPPRKDGWSTLLQDLAARPANGTEADRIVTDAGRIFARFEDTYQAVLA
ncbi:biliverdin-producing heme oxygenase [Aestuariibius sp. 2305UL40-4]|uniref:biliverdin-producing heme oxygenase n=1 Tax=Aestuariibius violaceus TaxID=3234132 RepID=UPI00345EFF8C